MLTLYTYVHNYAPSSRAPTCTAPDELGGDTGVPR